MRGPTSYTLVSFHAHPDDEALLVAGSLAKAAADGHRVVLVVATAGEQGLVSKNLLGDGSLGERRTAELRASAEAIGCARVVLLGYGDSGMDGSGCPGVEPFAYADREVAARTLASTLIEERADVLTIYDRAGGYGHPDHVQVHRVGVRAAELAQTALVLEATIDRVLLARAVRLLRGLRWLVPGMDLPDFRDRYTHRRDLTHRIDVRDQLAAKRAALSAHVTQASSEAGLRTIAFFLRLPRPLFRVVFGREWFVERGRRPTRPLATDLFQTLREGKSGPV
jgi:LmbE family N-acetylglucosaminyl deacetylase